jgi:hypothetical protein
MSVSPGLKSLLDRFSQGEILEKDLIDVLVIREYHIQEFARQHWSWTVSLEE